MTQDQQFIFVEALQASSNKHLKKAEAHIGGNEGIYTSNITTVFILNAIGGALLKALSSQ